MKKHTKIIICVFAFLIAAVAVLLWLNRDVILQGQKAQEERSLTFTENGEVISVLYWEQLKELEYETFDAVIKSSGQRPKNVVYTGIEIHTLLDAAGTDYNGKTLHFIGADAYLAAVQPEEMESVGSIFVVYAMDGQTMKDRESGGDGPYQLVLIDDDFSQRWCKYLAEVELR